MLAFTSPHVTRRGKCKMPLSYRRIYRLTPTEFSTVTNNRSDLKVESFLLKKTLYFVGWGVSFCGLAPA